MIDQKKLQRLCFLQGLYYFLTGLWPLVHINSFLSITGPKTDLWLVHTVGVLVIAISANLLLSAWRNDLSISTFTLAVLSALGLTAIDTIYVFNGTIWKTYLLDAFIEIVLVSLWFIFFRTRRTKRFLY